MRCLIYPLIAANILLSFSCRLVSNETKESFKTVDSSLKKSTRYINDSTSLLTAEIMKNSASHPIIAAKADSVYNFYVDISYYIDSLKNVLKERDSSLESIDIPTNLLITTPTGDTLMQKLTSLYLAARRNVTDSFTASLLYSIYDDRPYIDKKQRIWDYFHQTPTVAALTILSKLKNDCSSMSLIALKELYKTLPVQ